MFCVGLQVLKSDNNLRNSDVELQQRSVEYLQLSTVASTDVLVSRWTSLAILIQWQWKLIFTQLNFA